MTNPNPLDRIKSLAPADMTDDELGVAVYLAVGYPTQEHSLRSGGGLSTFFVMRKPGYSDHWSEPGISIQSDSVYWDHQFDRPQSSYDALLPIVREWVGRSPRRLRFILLTYIGDFTDEYNPEGISDLIESDTHGLLDITDTTVWCLLQATPRQLAEAFVTAAREVGNERNAPNWR